MNLKKLTPKFGWATSIDLEQYPQGQFISVMDDRVDAEVCAKREDEVGKAVEVAVISAEFLRQIADKIQKEVGYLRTDHLDSGRIVFTPNDCPICLSIQKLDKVVRVLKGDADGK